jgi:thiol:disulfide interchange protein
MYRGLVKKGMRSAVGGAVLLMAAITWGQSATAWGQAAAPIPHAHIYPDVQAAHTDIQAALAKARKEHKRVILDFGGDWCPDCQVLNIYFHQSPNKELVDKHYVLVDVNIGHEDANLDVARRYGVPMPHGVPALVVVDPSGKVLYAQNKEFSDMRNLQSSDLTTFLEAWKPRH